MSGGSRSKKWEKQAGKKKGKKKEEGEKEERGGKKEKRKKEEKKKGGKERRKGIIRRKGSKCESCDLREAFSNLHDSREKNKGKKKAGV